MKRKTIEKPDHLGVNRESVQFLQNRLSATADSMSAALNWDGLKTYGTRASYDPTSGEISVTIKFRVETADQERKSFDSGRRIFNLRAEAFRAPLVLRGKEYILVGFDFGRRRFPVVTKDATGKTVLWESTVLDKLPAILREPLNVEVREFQPRA